MAQFATATVSSKLSAADLFWWRVDEPKNPMVVNILFGCKDVLSYAAVQNFLQIPVKLTIRMMAVPRPHPIGKWRPLLLLGVVARVAFWKVFVFKCIFLFQFFDLP